MFRRKKPWVRFYSLEKAVEDLYPIIPASSLTRTWKGEGSKCPFSKITNILSAATCPGINQYVKMGWVITCPTDIVIKTNGDGSSFEWESGSAFMSQAGLVGNHPPDQTLPIIDSPRETLATTIKIETPWRCRASDDIVLIQTHVHWNNEERFTSATGIFDPRYALQCNVQLFWHKLNDEVLIKGGTPLAQYIPIPRKVLDKNWYDIYIDGAGEKEWQLEHSFRFTSHSIPRYDTLSDRLKRTITVISKYANGKNL